MEAFREEATIPFIMGDEIDLAEFLKYDDRKLISDIESVGCNSECWAQFQKFQNREKPYKQLHFHTINVDTRDYEGDLSRDPSSEVDELIDEIAKREEIRLPHRSIDELKRAGISLDDLKDWVTEENIYDPNYRDSGEAFQSFAAVSMDMGRRLTQIEVNIRIFVKQDSVYDEESLKNLLEERLTKYEEELRESLTE